METRPKQPATVWNEILTGPTALVAILVWVLESRVARPQGGDSAQHLPWIPDNRDSPTCGKWIKPLIKGHGRFDDFYVEARNYSPVRGAVTLIMNFYVRVLQHLWEVLATNCVWKSGSPTYEGQISIFISLTGTVDYSNLLKVFQTFLWKWRGNMDYIYLKREGQKWRSHSGWDLN